MPLRMVHQTSLCADSFQFKHRAFLCTERVLCTGSCQDTLMLLGSVRKLPSQLFSDFVLRAATKHHMPSIPSCIPGSTQLTECLSQVPDHIG